MNREQIIKILEEHLKEHVGPIMLNAIADKLEQSMKQGYHDVEEFYKDDENMCPKCKSEYIMEHRYDNSYKICMSCKYNWKT